MAIFGGALKQGNSVVFTFSDSPDAKFEEMKNIYGDVSGATSKSQTKTADMMNDEIDRVMQQAIAEHNATEPDATKHREFKKQGLHIYDIKVNDVKGVLRKITDEKNCKSWGREEKEKAEPVAKPAVASKAIVQPPPAPTPVVVPVPEPVVAEVAPAKGKGGRKAKTVETPAVVVIPPPAPIPVPEPVVAEVAPAKGKGGRKAKAVAPPVEQPIVVPTTVTATPAPKAKGTKQVIIKEIQEESDGDAVNP